MAYEITAYEITLPRLGWDMEEGSLAEWLKKDGEVVNSGELLFSIEGDKAVQEIEALDSGVLRILPNGPKPGEKVPVGTLLGYLVPQEELAAFAFPGQEAQVAAAARPIAEAIPAEDAPVSALAQLDSNGAAHRRIYISPYARRMAEGLGIDWKIVRGSGRDGRIMAKDIQEAAAKFQAAPVPPAVLPAAAPVATPAEQPAAPAAGAPVAGAVTRSSMTQVRRSIAEHMARSAHTTAPVTLTTEVDATELVALRKTLKNDPVAGKLPVPSYNDLLAKIVAQALQEHPMLNARIEGDEIVQYGEIHIGMAVDTERGLLVPVVRNVQAKTLRQIARESAALIEKTRTGTASYEDLQGGTFTITNLGMFEIDVFTPIINLPECAILGVGQIVPKQVVVDVENERVAIRQRMVLSLTFDHRLVDGAQAARFLQRVKRFVENPYLWMVG